MFGDIKDKITDAIDSIVDERLEYEENHIDAGTSYSYLPREGSYTYGNGDDRLAEFIKNNEIDTKGLDIEELSELVLDNFTMVPGHIFSGEKENVFCVDSFIVGEIEVQIDFADIKKMTGYRLTPLRAKKLGLENVEESYLYGHAPSDTVWRAEITASELIELINDKAD